MRAGIYVFNSENEVNRNNITREDKEEIKAESKIEDNDEIWYLEIPCIQLKATINEGTTKEVMDNFIGHFEDTSVFDGNIGLAAHNRGYKNNYFENLKKLKEGDLVLYYYRQKYREYVVNKQCIIGDTDWSYLQQTDDNRLTLITCVENEPSYRRCIQAIENIK